MLSTLDCLVVEGCHTDKLYLCSKDLPISGSTEKLLINHLFEQILGMRRYDIQHRSSTGQNHWIGYLQKKKQYNPIRSIIQLCCFFTGVIIRLLF